ncbi:MAG: glycosyltransferase [Candidatus Dadabacteria bacterium]|nr:MAG: glycosyltransferase [Candidatus Dadabacteria bacterium]
MTASEKPRSATAGEPEISVVIPLYNEEETLPVLIERLTRVLEGLGCPYEVLFVNDGSRDRTAEILRAAHRDNPRIKAIGLSRNFGHQVAISCGIDFAQGNAVIVMDGDLQDPPEVLPDLIERWRQGYDVVYAIRQKRKEGALKRAAYKTFYWLLRKVSYLDIPLDSGDFSLMDRRVVDLLRKMPERNRFVRGLRTWVGLRQTGYEYARSARYAGRSKYNFAKLMRLAFDGLVSYSFVPLRAVSNLGMLVSLSALLYIVYLLVMRALGDRPIQGWTSTVVIVLFLGGVQLLALGVLGEYVGRIFDEVKGRPHYIVSEVVGLVRRPEDVAGEVVPNRPEELPAGVGPGVREAGGRT